MWWTIIWNVMHEEMIMEAVTGVRDWLLHTTDAPLPNPKCPRFSLPNWRSAPLLSLCNPFFLDKSNNCWWNHIICFRNVMQPLLITPPKSMKQTKYQRSRFTECLVMSFLSVTAALLIGYVYLILLLLSFCYFTTFNVLPLLVFFICIYFFIYYIILMFLFISSFFLFFFFNISTW